MATIAAGIGTMTGNYGGAARIAGRLLTPAHPVRARLLARMQRTYYALAEGSWPAARAELVAMAALDPEVSVQIGGVAAALPFGPVPAGERDSIESLVKALDPARPPSELWRTAIGLRETTRAAQRYWLLAVLSTGRGDLAAARRWIDSLHAGADSTSREWGLEENARAVAWLRSGRPADALAALDAIHRSGTLGSFPRSVLYTHAFERATRAAAYAALGRADDAAAWRDTFRSFLSVADLPYNRRVETARGE